MSRECGDRSRENKTPLDPFGEVNGTSKLNGSAPKMGRSQKRDGPRSLKTFADQRRAFVPAHSEIKRLPCLLRQASGMQIWVVGPFSNGPTTQICPVLAGCGRAVE